jgi:hypothetical protein
MLKQTSLGRNAKGKSKTECAPCGIQVMTSLTRLSWDRIGDSVDVLPSYRHRAE